MITSAIIGLGRIGCGFDDSLKSNKINTHAGAYRKNKNTKLISLCDVDNNKLSKYGKKYHVKSLYTNYEKMLQTENIDCISICTLADSHYEIVKQIAKFDVKGIFLEKPISNSLSDAKKIIDICSHKNIKLQIDHQRRFSSFYQKIKKTIHQSAFGEIQHVNVYYGSGIFNTGTHVLDLLRFFFGNIKWVEGKFSLNESGFSSEPNIDGKILFQNNILCSLIGLNTSTYRILEFDIVGTKARIIINLANSSADYYEISKKKGLVYGSIQKKSYINNEKKEHILSGLEDLIKAIEHNTETICTGYDGYSTLEASLALHFSAKNNGKRIELPLDSNIDYNIM